MYIQQKWLIFHYKLIIGNFDYNKCSKWPPFDLIHNSALLLMLPTQLLMKSGLKLSKKSSTTFFNLGMVEGWASQTFWNLKKIEKNGCYASCAWVMVIIDMNYQNVNISGEDKRIFFKSMSLFSAILNRFKIYIH